MGGGTYSSADKISRDALRGMASKSINETFTQRSVNKFMKSFDLSVRESRDSKEHPESLAIIIAIDVTGSMGHIPHYLVNEGLPKIMDTIISKNIKDPQILFLGVGDHTCDRFPLQVGQFESDDKLIDQWLTSIFLEQGGGGNDGESYHLAWFFAANYTSIDCFEKRSQKGFLFTIGDEKCLQDIPGESLKKIIGLNQTQSYSSTELLDLARERYEVCHLHLRQGTNGNRSDVIDHWKQNIGSDNLKIITNFKKDIVDEITSLIISKIKAPIEDMEIETPKIETPIDVTPIEDMEIL